MLDAPWWESVDSITPVVGKIVSRSIMQNNGSASVMDEWLHHESFWIRRSAMTHQLGWRLQTDESRLFHYALTLAPETEFFIRKGIGWALRDYARWNPSAVRDFLKHHGDQFSGLTLREAGKHL
jgi:3-methyladenine DNA glycosylase AlkD